MMSAMKLPSRRQAQDGSLTAWQPMPAWSWMLAAVAVLIVTAGVIIWLLAIAGGAKPGSDRANSRLDAVRTGLAAGAAVGAAAGLFLAFRRQHHQEVATKSSDHDAIERRITELYTKAVEQLGSDKAPVRLGGLYALERLAQDNPAHRQTIVNVICAYLRMPFSPTAPTGTPEQEAIEAREVAGTEAETSTVTPGDTWQQERQVRLTAQRILAGHLRDDRAKERSIDRPTPQFWPGIRLDLAGATLIDFNLVNGVMADVNFTGATLSGGAWFDGATFSRAWFDGVTFDGEANFQGATFNGGVRFVEAAFNGDGSFREATFSGGVRFVQAAFNGEVEFGEATFSGGALFGGATFRGGALFRKATFSGDAGFVQATFSRGARFDGASFGGGTLFRGATFGDGTSFRGATFSRGALFGWATFDGGALFGRTTFDGNAMFGGATFCDDAFFDEATFGDAGFVQATFSRGARFDGTTFDGEANFDGATFSDSEGSLSFGRSRVLSPGAQHVWPPGWCLGPDGSGGYRVVRANDDASQPIPGDASDGSQS